MSSGTLAPEAVRQMFDRISPVYDLMNRVLTAGLDGRWRRLTAAAVVRPGDRVLDACCGTGDLALADLAAGGEVTALDFSERMLELARPKSSRPCAGSAETRWRSRSRTRASTSATIGFGIRNVSDLEGGPRGAGTRCFRRAAASAVWRSRSRVGSSVPSSASGSTSLIPFVGKMLPGGAAYTYLPASVRRFPGPEELAAAMERSGFIDVTFRLLAGGIVTLHTAGRA